MTGYGDYPSAPPAPAPEPGGASNYAGWWRRAGASLIDGIILGVVSSLIALALGNSTVARYGVELVLGLIYAVVLIGMQGKTVGNMALGTRVVLADGGTEIGYPKALVRWAVQAVLGITVIGGILDILWPLWDPRNQTLHDKAAATLVVKT